MALACQYTPGTIFDTSAILVFHINVPKLLCGALGDMKKDLAGGLLYKAGLSLQYHTAFS